MHAFSRQVCICGQVLGNSNVGGHPLRKGRERVPAPIMAVHSRPLQGGHDEGGMDGCIVSEDLEAPDHFIHGPKTCLNLPGTSRDVAATLGQHFLLFSLSLLQVAFECLASVLFFFFLFFLSACRLMSSRDEDFLLSWLALAPATLAMTPVHTPASPDQLVTLPGRGLGMFVWVQWGRRQSALGMSPLITAGIHLPTRHVLGQAQGGGGLLDRGCCCAALWCGSYCPYRIKEFLRCWSLRLRLHSLHYLNNDPPRG